MAATTDRASERARGLMRDHLRALHPYVVPPAAGCIKLDAMENPFPWPEELRGPWTQRLAQVQVNRYPDAAATALKERLRTHYAIAADEAICIGNGSDELIQLLALAYGGPGRVIMTPEPGFSMYRIIALATGSGYCGVDLNPDFSLNTEAMLAAMARQPPALLFIAQPNNPTGNLFDVEALTRLIEACPGLVVLDEAYGPFSSADFSAWTGRHPNLVGLRTLSKVGLAGLRLGVLFGAQAWLEPLERIRLPYNVGTLSQASATFALEHFAVLQAQLDRLKQERSRLAARLGNLPAVQGFHSEANFILLRLGQDARAVHERLRDHHRVLVKCLHGTHPLLDQCLRVTVGAPDENDALLEALEECLGRPSPEGD